MHSDKLRLTLTASVVLCLASSLISCAATPEPPTSPSAVPEIRKGSGYLAGYLSQDSVLKSDIFLPEAPRQVDPGSTDLEAARAAFAARSLPRWNQAAADADLKFPGAARHFSCALGFELTEAGTPHLVMLLRRTMADTGLATTAAKNRYNRTRPFVHLHEQSCTPQDEPFLARDGSYPSGHAAVGWAWALTLSELAPSRREAVLRRGYNFGQSRVACGVHWQSDVNAGRVVGAAAVSALRSNEVFVAQMALAKAEVASVLAKKPGPPAHCAAEESALANF